MTETALVQADEQDAGPRLAFLQTGTGGEIMRIALRNALFNILTLGIYRFWGVTHVRRYLWSHMQLEGEPLDYTGTGKELFLGFLLALLIIVVPLSLLGWLRDYFLDHQVEAWGAALQLMITLGTLFVMGFAAYRARRYRLTRTVWRGIRGGQAGAATSYALRWAGWLVACALTLGLLWPLRSLKLQRYRMAHLRLGDQPVAFDTRLGPLYKRFLWVWVLLLLVAALYFGGLAALLGGAHGSVDDSAPILAIALILVCLTLAQASYGLYRLFEIRHFAAGTRFGELRLTMAPRLGPAAALVLGNWLLTMLTLGIAAPYAQLRTARFIARHAWIEGRYDYDALRQSQLDKPRQGEGAFSLFDNAEIA